MYNNRENLHNFSNNIKKVITIGNLDFEQSAKISVKIPKYNPHKQNLLPIKISTMPESKNGKLLLNLLPGETVVVIIHELL